jgi:hypothetical protein
MARFILISPIYGAPSSAYQPKKWPRDTTIADSVGNALAGDLVWPAIANAPAVQNVAPLDAAGQALMPGSVITTLAQLASGYGTVGNSAGATLDAVD